MPVRNMLQRYLVAAAGPLVMGYLRSINGDFQTSLWLLVAVGVTILIVTPFIQPTRLKR